MATSYVTETIHMAAVKDGPLPRKVDGKTVSVDINRLRRAIPKHCFEPTLARSMSYVVSDVAQYFALLASVIWLNQKVEGWPNFAIRYLAFPFLASLPLTGLWVNAHECGHGAFSKNQSPNNAIGLVLHSIWLTPYFSWRSSHARHHQYANNMSNDLNYVPLTRGQYQKVGLASATATSESDHIGEDSPAFLLCRIVLQQLLGWPWYLFTHITAGPQSSPRPSRGWWDNSHFLPSSSLFRPSEAWDIVISDVGILAMSFCLYRLGNAFGSSNMVWAYVLPWLWVNHWIVMITYLHHTSPSLPKYTEKSWTYLRGALATVDRNPGVMLKYMLHHIIDLHVIHHLFPRIPHYYARDATEAIKPLLGELYHVDDQGFWSSLWSAFSQCQWVEPDPNKTIKFKITTKPRQ